MIVATALSIALLFPIQAIDGGTDGGVDAGVDAGTPVTALGPCKTVQTICFSPGNDCDVPLIAVLDSATKTLDIAIYSLNRIPIVDGILRAKARGVKVRMIVDVSQTGQPKEMVQLLRLKAANIPIKRDSHAGIMHLKLIVADSSTFSIGSFNFTDPAVQINDENIFVWTCPRNAVIYTKHFNELWDSVTGFKTLEFKDGGL